MQAVSDLSPCDWCRPESQEAFGMGFNSPDMVRERFHGNVVQQDAVPPWARTRAR